MKLSVVADLIYEIFYNGKPQGDGSKMDVDDFFQFAITSAGAIIRKMFYEEDRMSQETSTFISSMVDIKQVKVVKGRMGIKGIDESIMIMPRNAGIFNVYPLVDNCGDKEVDYSNAFFPILPGTEWYYDQNRIDDLGLKAYTLRGGKPVLYCEDSIEDVALEGVFRDDDFDVPESVAREIINDILSTVLKVAGFPIDMTDDGDPNVKLINQKIASNQAA